VNILTQRNRGNRGTYPCPPETQMILLNAGIDEYQYNNASMGEKEYWLDCR
jgi:hypothetical protein